MTAGLAERVRCPRALGSSPSHPGGSGIMPAGTMTGARGASLEVDAVLAGATRRIVGAAVHEAWPELSLWDEQSLGQEPRWNAERRAAPAGAAPHRKVRRLDFAPFGVPLPFSFVIASVSEAIQCNRAILDCFVVSLLAMTTMCPISSVCCADRDPTGPTAGKGLTTIMQRRCVLD